MRLSEKHGRACMVISAAAAVVLLGNILHGASSRLVVECVPQEIEGRSVYRCEKVSGTDSVRVDSRGTVITLSPGDFSPNAEILVQTKSIGPSGRGGARFFDGSFEVVDAAGRVTHRDFMPVSLASFLGDAGSVTILGNAGTSPVNVDLRSLSEGVSSGSAVFIGEADTIRIDVSGRDGANGRGAGKAAALQFLRGEFGSGPDVRALAARFGLTGSVSEPEASLSDVAGSAAQCEALPGNYITPEDLGDGTVRATVGKARELVVERAACERLTSQEYSIETSCARPPQVSATLRCEYPTIEKRQDTWKRGAEVKKVSISCSESVPPGQWNTKCASEGFAVVGSALKPEYLSLAPSTSLEEGMGEPLFHHWANASSECSTDLGRNLLGSTPSDTKFANYILSTMFSSKPFKGDSDLIVRDYETSVRYCNGGYSHKMDNLRLTGALVERYPFAAFPGTLAEKNEGSALDIRKLSYWSERGSNSPVQADGQPLERASTDSLSESSKKIGRYYAIDPNAAEITAGEKTRRQNYFAELARYKLDPPTLASSVVSYEQLHAKREKLSGGNSLRDALCNMPTITSRYPAGNDPNEMCDRVMDGFGQNASTIAASSLKFREKITYRFTKLRSGFAARRQGVPGDELESFYRTLSKDAEFEPRAIFIPGDLDLAPITRVEYCSTIQIDTDDTILSTSSAVTHRFVGPEVAGGVGLTTHKIARMDLAGEDGKMMRQTSVGSTDLSAPSNVIFPWASSFMSMREVNLSSAGCVPVTVTHSLNATEKETFEKFRNQNALLLIAQGNTITVYMSPVKTPQLSGTPQNGRLEVGMSLSPGLYFPLIDVAPMELDLGGFSFHYSSDIVGTGNPVRRDLGSGELSPLRDQIPYSANIRLKASENDVLSYYAIPARVQGKQVKTTGTMLPAKGSIFSRGPGNARVSVGTSADGAPRYIKTLRELHLGISSGGASSSPTTTSRDNVFSLPDVILSRRLGLSAGASSQQCFPSGKLTYPTKLISRRAEPIVGGRNFKSVGQDVDMNVVMDDEVSTASGTRSSYVPNNLFFTRAFIPTSMRRPIDDSSNSLGFEPSPDEPYFLAQDYNSYLAQLQKMSGLSQIAPDSSGPKYSWTKNLGNYSLRVGANQYAKIYKEVGDRRPGIHRHLEPGNPQPDPTIEAPYASVKSGRSLRSEGERDCLAANPTASSGDPSAQTRWCLEYVPHDSETPDLFRAYRPPFSIFSLRLENAITKDDYSSSVCTTGLCRHHISHAGSPMYRGVRPYAHYAIQPTLYFSTEHHPIFNTAERHWSEFQTPHQNAGAENTGESDPASWMAAGQNTIQGNDFYTGHFLPFARTKRWIFDGDKGGYRVLKPGFQPGDEQIWGTQSYPATPLLTPALQGKVLGGVHDSNRMGSNFNPGGLFLPPHGVSISSLRFERFLAAYNMNCDMYDDATDTVTNWTCQHGYTNDVHQIDAAFHLFTPTSSTTRDVFASRGDLGTETDVHTTTIDLDLQWIGQSGYMTEECSDSLLPGSLISGKTNQLPLSLTGGASVSSPHVYEVGVKTGGDDSFPRPILSAAYLPLGLALDESGGLYFGPLMGDSLKPYSSSANDLRVSFTERLGRVPNFTGLAGSILTALNYDSPSEVRISRSTPASGRTATVARIIEDANADFASGNVAPFDYEQKLALVPEVLAAFFLHANLRDSSVSNGSIVPADSFDEILGSFVSSRARSEISTKGFVKNRLAVSSGVHSSSQSHVAPLYFAMEQYTAPSPVLGPKYASDNARDAVMKKRFPEVSFSWHFVEDSLHMSVISMSATTDEANSSQNGVQSIRSGVAVAYGSEGAERIFGAIDDVYEYSTAEGLVSLTRSSGLSTESLREKFFSIKPLAGAESVGQFVDPSASFGGVRPYVFAEALCAKKDWREKFVPYVWNNAHGSFSIEAASDGGETGFIAPFLKFCRAGATKRLAAAAAGPGIGSFPAQEAHNYVYVDFIRREIETSVAGGPFVDPENPPVCPVGSELLTQNFVVSGGYSRQTYFASNGWSGTINPTSPSPGCPCAPGHIGACNESNNMIEVARTYATLFSDVNQCYDAVTGSSVADARSDRSAPTCVSATSYCSLPGFVTSDSCLQAGATWNAPGSGNFSPTVVELAHAQFVVSGSPKATPSSGPTGVYSPYSIYVSTSVLLSRSVDVIKPSAKQAQTLSGIFDPETNTYWRPEGDPGTIPECESIPFNSEGYLELSPSIHTARISPRWTYLEEKRRYGELDPYRVRTRPKQVSISDTSHGEAAAISAAADSCDWSSVTPSSTVPELMAHVATEGGGHPGLFEEYTFQIGLDYLPGASASVTSRQYTPWSSERGDGLTMLAPSCAIFDDETALAREKIWEVPEGGGTFDINEGTLRSTYLSGSPDSVDSSLLNQPRTFATGGRWIQVGAESHTLTRENSVVTVRCVFQKDQSSGGDYCDDGVALSYESVDGFQVTTRAEDGEHGGVAGGAVVLSSLPPGSIEVSSRAGTAGLAGGTFLPGASGGTQLVCFERSSDVLNPSIKLYRFNKAAVSVAPGNEGNDGRGGSQRTSVGWGVMPESIDWLQRNIKTDP